MLLSTRSMHPQENGVFHAGHITRTDLWYFLVYHIQPAWRTLLRAGEQRCKTRETGIYCAQSIALVQNKKI